MPFSPKCIDFAPVLLYTYNLGTIQEARPQQREIQPGIHRGIPPGISPGIPPGIVRGIVCGIEI